MNVCQVVPSLQPEHGGPSKSVYALSAALARAGHQVDLFTTEPDGGTTQQEGNLHIQRFARRWPQRFCASSGLKHALRESTATVFHHHALWLRTLHYTHRAARRRGVLVLSPRGMMSPWSWHHHRWRKEFARALIHPAALEAVAGWHATSAAEEAEIRGHGFEQPVCVAPNGVSAPGGDEHRVAKAHWEQACRETTSRPVALFYSRFHRKKRVLELIDLWLEEAPRDWLLLLVGIPQEYTPEALERYVAQSAGYDRVVVFSGAGRPVPYPVASLFLLPSHSENFGLAVAEAMAHGVPVVVTDTTPWHGVNEQSCGWCVPWAEYREALRAATREAECVRQERGRRAQAWVLREFSWDRSAGRLAEFYASLTSRAIAAPLHA